MEPNKPLSDDIKDLIFDFCQHKDPYELHKDAPLLSSVDPAGHTVFLKPENLGIEPQTLEPRSIQPLSEDQLKSINTKLKSIAERISELKLLAETNDEVRQDIKKLLNLVAEENGLMVTVDRYFRNIIKNSSESQNHSGLIERMTPYVDADIQLNSIKNICKKIVDALPDDLYPPRIFRFDYHETTFHKLLQQSYKILNDLREDRGDVKAANKFLSKVSKYREIFLQLHNNPKSQVEIFDLRDNCAEIIEQFNSQSKLDTNNLNKFGASLITRFGLRPGPKTLLAMLKQDPNLINTFVDRKYRQTFTLSEVNEYLNFLLTNNVEITNPSFAQSLEDIYKFLLSQLPLCHQKDSKFALDLATAFNKLQQYFNYKCPPKMELPNILKEFNQAIKTKFVTTREPYSEDEIPLNYARLLAFCAISPVLYRSVIHPKEKDFCESFIKPEEVDLTLLGINEIDYQGAMALVRNQIFKNDFQRSLKASFKLALSSFQLADYLSIAPENTIINEYVNEVLQGVERDSSIHVFDLIELPFVISNKEITERCLNKMNQFFCHVLLIQADQLVDYFLQVYYFIVLTSTKLDITDPSEMKRIKGEDYNKRMSDFIMSILICFKTNILKEKKNAKALDVLQQIFLNLDISNFSLVELERLQCRITPIAESLPLTFVEKLEVKLLDMYERDYNEHTTEVLDDILKNHALLKKVNRIQGHLKRKFVFLRKFIEINHRFIKLQSKQLSDLNILIPLANLYTEGLTLLNQLRPHFYMAKDARMDKLIPLQMPGFILSNFIQAGNGLEFLNQTSSFNEFIQALRELYANYKDVQKGLSINPPKPSMAFLKVLRDLGLPIAELTLPARRWWPHPSVFTYDEQAQIIKDFPGTKIIWT